MRMWEANDGKGGAGRGALYDARREPDSSRNGSRECGVPFTQPQPLIHSRHHRVVRSENLRETVHSAFAHFDRSRVSVRELASLPRRLAAFGISRLHRDSSELARWSADRLQAREYPTLKGSFYKQKSFVGIEKEGLLCQTKLLIQLAPNGIHLDATC